MKIQQLTATDLKETTMLYNKVSSTNWLFHNLGDNAFQHAFLPKKHIKTFTYKQDNTIVGFASGTINKQTNKGYITMILVKKSYRFQGIGTSLLHTLEQALYKTLPTITSIDIVFFNPVHLPWILPNTTRHTHPNMPGVYVQSFACRWFSTKGYTQYALQDVYHRSILRIKKYPEITKTIHTLKTNDITFTTYNNKTHHNLDLLFDSLHNPSWKQAVNHGLNNNLELLVVIHKDTVIGFAGPITIEPSKRGYFAGIGVHPAYRKQGIASALFYMLCRALSGIGAEYMTLFTGRNNPAKFVYKKLGFNVAASFVNYRKERNNEKNL